MFGLPFWVTHMMVADRVLQELPWLSRHEYCVGNIAPDCNVENEDWSGFTPPREMTHWMSAGRKNSTDCQRFIHEYLLPRNPQNAQEASFLWGYYTHLVTDAEFQSTIRDEERVRAAWKRIQAIPELAAASEGMPESWDSVKRLIPRDERYREIGTIECEYLDAHPNSGFLTEIVGLTDFPDLLEFLPAGAIVRKIGVLGNIPEKGESRYPFTAMTRTEYTDFVDRAVELSVKTISQYWKCS